MPSNRPAIRRSCFLLALTCLIPAGRASGQLQTTDPYDPYGAPYRGSTYPGYVNDPSFYNRPIFRPNGGPNQMEGYYRSVDSLSPDLLGDFSERYDQRFRSYADAAGRNGEVDNGAEVKFFKDRFRRDELYFQLQREKDPKKRAELSAELKKVSATVTRDASDRRPSRTRTSASGGSTPPPVNGARRPQASAGPRPFVLPAYASFRAPEPDFRPSSSLPPPPRLGGDAPATAGGSTPAAQPDRSPSAVLERALSRPRRGAPPIPGLENAPR